MRNKYCFKIAILSIIFFLLFTGCAKDDRDIANEVANIDPYFRGYELELSDYTITKRQTNDDDKTDFVWISLSGENEDFLYTASYEVTYIKYNDGWHLETYNMLNSNYKAKGRPSSDEVCSSLSERYSNIEYVSSEPFTTSNNASYCLTGEVVDGYITKSFDIIISYEFFPDRGWVEVSESKNLSSSQYNIIGEWQYEDAEHLYYLHIAEVDGNSVTMKYTFWNKNISPDDDYWQLRQSEYTTYDLNSLSDNEYYLDVGWYKKYSTVYFADESYIWFCNHDVTVHGIVDNGVVVNGYYLKRISENRTDANYPSALKTAVENYIVDYSYIPDGLFDEVLTKYLDYLNMPYAKLEPLIRKSGINQKYSLGKAKLIDNQVYVWLWILPEGDSLPDAIELEGTGYSVDELRGYFQTTLNLPIYEDSTSGFIVVIPNTDLRLRVWVDIFSAKVDIYLNR